MANTLYDYYEQQPCFATYANFRSEAELAAYSAKRQLFFSSLLKLPPCAFQGCQLVEFGPDTGENILAFAKWGASITAVEPHLRAHKTILNYFKKFNLEKHLSGLIGVDLQTFSPDLFFDFAVAEGFIYTVKPTADWLAKLHSVLKPGGLAVISYYESSACLPELSLRLIYQFAKLITDKDPALLGQELFATKWQQLSHTRSIDSWLMDIIESPFIRLENFLDASELCKLAHQAGFSLYSSWPNYQDNQNIYWHKAIPDPAELLQGTIESITRNQLTMAFAKPLYLNAGEEKLTQYKGLLNNLISSVDSALDATSFDGLNTLTEALQALMSTLADEQTLRDEKAKQSTLSYLSSLGQIVQIIQAQDYPQLVKFLNQDEAFLTNWGLPVHHGVFQKMIVN